MICLFLEPGDVLWLEIEFVFLLPGNNRQKILGDFSIKSKNLNRRFAWILKSFEIIWNHLKSFEQLSKFSLLNTIYNRVS